jgi:hypothetical protein
MTWSELIKNSRIPKEAILGSIIFPVNAPQALRLLVEKAAL